ICIAAIPAAAMRKAAVAPVASEALAATSVEAAVSEPIAGSEQPVAAGHKPFLTELREGLRYIRVTPFVRAVILVNIGWGTGGGMNSILFDQIGGHVFSGGDRGDWKVAMLFTAGGAGVFFGMLLSRRIAAWVS